MQDRRRLPRQRRRWPDKQHLDALVQTLVQAKVPIPPETQALLDQMKQEDARDNAKSLHRAVSMQTAD